MLEHQFICIYCTNQIEINMKDVIKKHGYTVKHIAGILGITPGAMQYRLKDPMTRFSLRDLRTIADQTTIEYVELIENIAS